MLSEGTWVGTDGGGVAGTGTGVLVVSKAAVAGLTGGIDVDGSSVRADVALRTADFSTLAGGLSVTGAWAVTQTGGQTLTVSTIDVSAAAVRLGGAVVGGAGAVTFAATDRVRLFEGSSITTTSGAIALAANDADTAAAVAGVEINGATVETGTGAVTIRGGGRNDGTAGAGVSLIGFTRITSTGAGAGDVQIVGTGGVAIPGSGSTPGWQTITSETGDILIQGIAGRDSSGNQIGGGSVYIGKSNLVRSTGTTADAATITILGETFVGGNGVNLYLCDIWSTSGDISISGTSTGGIRFAAGAGVRMVSVSQGEGMVRSDGVGADAASITIFGSTTSENGTGIETNFYGVSPTGLAVSTISGDVTITGVSGYVGITMGRSAGVRSFGTGADAGEIRTTGTGHFRGVYIDSLHSIDGDVFVSGIALRQEATGNVAAGVWMWQAALTGDANLTITGRSDAPAGLAQADVQFGGPSGDGTLSEVSAAGGTVRIIADEVTVYSDARIRNRLGRVVIAPRTAGRAIDVGGVDSAGALGLTSGELSRIATLDLRVGDGRSGDIRLSGPVQRRSGAGTLTLTTAGAVVDAGNDFATDLTVDRLAIRAGVVGGPQAGTLDVSATRFVADVTGWIYLNNAGDLSLGNLAASEIRIFVDGSMTTEAGATLNLDRLRFRPPLVPAIYPPPRLVPPVTITSSSAGPVVGTFAGLPEGATVTTSRGDVARVTYAGGDGNDIVVSLDQPPVVEDERFRIREDETAYDNLLTNDGDPNGDPLTVVNVNGGSPVGDFITYAGGVLFVEADGSFTFDPDNGFDDLLPGESRVVTFRYTVADGTGKTAVGEATIVVYGDGRTDLAGYVDGEWYVTAFDGLGQKTVRAAQWANVAWDALLHADANGDGRSDVIGLIDGQWWIGYAYGGLESSAYWTIPVDRWSDAAWRDATLRDLNGDGEVDLLARVGGEWWAALSDGTGGSYLTPTKWTTWNATEWDAIFVEDVNADGRDDLIGYLDGEWWVSRSSGTGFEAARLWERWANVEWHGLGVFDVNGDGAADVYGLYGSESYYGMSVDSGVFQGRLPVFSTGVHGYWAQGGNWRDVRAGDFDGDGLTNDLAARSGGDWYVVVSYLPPQSLIVPDRPRLPQPRSAALWADWAEIAWEDVRAGDFDGDGRTDLVGRYAGDWYLARTVAGGGFEADLFATWAEADWQAVAAVEFDELTNWPSPPRSGGGIIWSGSGTSISYAPSIDIVDVVEIAVISPLDPEPAATAPVASEDDSLDVFWSQAEEDEAFAEGLLAGV